MKKIIFKLISISVILLILSCSDDDLKEVSGTLEFTTEGSDTFMINASDISATITIVGAGGGGGGGVIYNGMDVFSTGGGGGGGAGDVKIIGNVSLQKNVTYTIVVGAGGNGGNPGNIGLKGAVTTISLEMVELYTAASGTGGFSNTIGINLGGNGGAGFPAGSKGGDGEILDVDWDGNAGAGGQGGDNLSNYGIGGDGGKGADVDNKIASSDATTGLSGGNGYIKIEWTGMN